MELKDETGPFATICAQLTHSKMSMNLRKD